MSYNPIFKKKSINDQYISIFEQMINNYQIINITICQLRQKSSARLLVTVVARTRQNSKKSRLNMNNYVIINIFAFINTNMPIEIEKKNNMVKNCLL